MFACLLLLSPFWIDFPACPNPTAKDYERLAEQLSDPIVNERICDFFAREDFAFPEVRGRVFTAQTFEIFHPKYPPEIYFKKIGNGGPHAIVTCVGHEGKRPKKLLFGLEKALNKIGFNGYLYARISGFPNPTGIELRYAAIPYSFKIFLMQEAYQLGFNTLLWVDSRLFPVNDLTPLFRYIEIHGGLFVPSGTLPTTHVCKQARDAVIELTGFDPCESQAISTGLLGLSMERKEVKKIVKDFYTACEMGTPFFSCFPEETILSALLKKHFSDPPYVTQYAPNDSKRLFRFAPMGRIDQKFAIFTKRKGFYFFGVSDTKVSTVDTLDIPDILNRTIYDHKTLSSL